MARRGETLVVTYKGTAKTPKTKTFHHASWIVGERTELVLLVETPGDGWRRSAVFAPHEWLYVEMEEN